MTRRPRRAILAAMNTQARSRPAAFQDSDAIRAAPFQALTFPLNALWPD